MRVVKEALDLEEGHVGENVDAGEDNDEDDDDDCFENLQVAGGLYA